jgi:hypothetical protein
MKNHLAQEYGGAGTGSGKPREGASAGMDQERIQATEASCLPRTEYAMAIRNTPLSRLDELRPFAKAPTVTRLSESISRRSPRPPAFAPLFTSTTRARISWRLMCALRLNL